jgi:hypothetical protein
MPPKRERANLLDTTVNPKEQYLVLMPINTNLDILLDRLTMDPCETGFLKKSCQLFAGPHCTAWRSECSSQLKIVSHHVDENSPVEILTTTVMDDGEHWLKLFFNERRNEKRDSWDIIIYFSTFPGITHIAPLLLRDTLQLISSEPFHLVDFINGNVRSTPAKKRKRASFEEKPLNIRYTDEWHRAVQRQASDAYESDLGEAARSGPAMDSPDAAGQHMSGRGDFEMYLGGKAGKGAVKRGPVKKRRTEEDAYDLDVYEPYDSDLDEDLPLAARSGPAMDSRVQRHCGGAAAAGPPAPAAATRQTERTARDSEELIRVLRADKRKLTSTNEEHGQTIKELREQLAAANAELAAANAEKDNSQAGQQDLAARLAKATDELRCHRGKLEQLKLCTDAQLAEYLKKAWTAVDSILYEQYMRIEKQYNTEYEEKQGLARPECPICQELFNGDTVILPCSHSFCKKCIEPWLISHGKCPLKCGIYSPADMIPNRVMCQSSVVINDPKQVRDLKITAEVGKLHQQLAVFYERSCKRVRSYTT